MKMCLLVALAGLAIGFPCRFSPNRKTLSIDKQSSSATCSALPRHSASSVSLV